MLAHVLLGFQSMPKRDDDVVKPRILLAEDDYDVRVGLARYLVLEGYEVRVVTNGAELLDLLSGWILGDLRDPPADLLVTDVRMPGFNGLRIVEGLRASGRTMPVVIISAFADAEMIAAVDAMDNVELLPKPFEPAELEATVRRLSMQ